MPISKGGYKYNGMAIRTAFYMKRRKIKKNIKIEKITILN
jgi:hypothetical protein